MSARYAQNPETPAPILSAHRGMKPGVLFALLAVAILLGGGRYSLDARLRLPF